jgi:hypothetical protein
LSALPVLLRTRSIEEETTMPVDLNRTLRQALTALTSERDRLDRKIAGLRALLGDGSRQGVTGGGGRRRRRMSAAARRAVSQRMKAYWAGRRAKKAKAKAG